MKIPGFGALDLHAIAIDNSGRGGVRVVAWRYGYRATVSISRTAMEDTATARQAVLVMDALWEAAESLWGLPIIDHDPGDEDRFA